MAWLGWASGRFHWWCGHYVLAWIWMGSPPFLPCWAHTQFYSRWPWKVHAESDLVCVMLDDRGAGGWLSPETTVFSLWPVCNRVWAVSMLGRVQTEKLSVRKQRVAVGLGQGLTRLSSVATTAGSTPHVILIRGLCKSYLNTTLITLFRNIRMCGRVPGTGFPHVLGVCRRHRVCTSVTGTRGGAGVRWGGGGRLWDKSRSPSLGSRVLPRPA